MIKTFTPTEQSNMKMNIDLLDGKKYLGCDVVDNPFCVANTVSFWHENVIMIIPLDLVKSIEVYSQP